MGDELADLVESRRRLESEHHAVTVNGPVVSLRMRDTRDMDQVVVPNAKGFTEVGVDLAIVAWRFNLLNDVQPTEALRQMIKGFQAAAETEVGRPINWDE